MIGNKYGTHRVLKPKGSLPQPALQLDNDFSKVYSNEILCDVETLNVDAASFENLKEKANGNPAAVALHIAYIVSIRRKLHNPETGSGGMFLGTVNKVGSDLDVDLKPGDKIASLVSLSLTPLNLRLINEVHMDTAKVDVKGQAVLFENSVWVKIPEDLPEALVLSVLDVAGAPAQTDKWVWPYDTVAVLGAGGKSGMLCCYQAKKRMAKKVIAVIHKEEGREDVDNAPFIDEVVVADASNALDLLEKIEHVTDGKLCNNVISCVSRPGCEMGAILITAEGGVICFFSMATDFTKATLGAEGVGKDIDMIMGNGYCVGHAELALDIMRDSEYLRSLYEKRYC